MKKLFLLTFFLYNLYALSAKNNLRISDIRTLGMGGNGGSHSALFNASLLPLFPDKEIRLDYFNRYSLEELATLSAGVRIPNRMLPVGLHVASFGYDKYRESLLRFSAGKKLTSNWALGVGFQYILLESEIYETSPSFLSTDLGVSYLWDENRLITLSIINFPSLTIQNDHKENMSLNAYLAELSMNWWFINNLLITGGVRHGKTDPFSASLGMEYIPFTDFQFRAGIRTSPMQPSLGIGYRFMHMTVDAAFVYHPVLGVSSGLGLSYTF